MKQLKNILIRSIVAALLVGSSCGKNGIDEYPTRPPSVTGQAIFQADPTIFSHQANYFLYGTDGDTPDKGIKVYVSPDLKQWKLSANAGGGFALSTGASFGTKGFWAPQVWASNGKFYMAYVANEQIAIASSDSPEGPFTAKTPVEFDQKNIDPYVFFDEDGKKYLYHVDITNGNKIYVATINNDFTAIDKTSRVLCITAEMPWETVQARVAEGPTIIKHKGIYYMIYSANHFENQQYAVGYATATSPLGPWTKAVENPILSMKNTGKPGVGHGDVFVDRDGKMNYVCHTHNAMDKVSPRRTGLVPLSFVPVTGGKDKLVMDVEHFRLLRTAP